MEAQIKLKRLLFSPKERPALDFANGFFPSEKVYRTERRPCLGGEAGRGAVAIDILSLVINKSRKGL